MEMVKGGVKTSFMLVVRRILDFYLAG